MGLARAQLTREDRGGLLVREEHLDATKAAASRRSEPLEERHLREHEAEIGGELHHVTSVARVIPITFPIRNPAIPLTGIPSNVIFSF